MENNRERIQRPNLVNIAVILYAVSFIGYFAFVIFEKTYKPIAQYVSSNQYGCVGLTALLLIICITQIARGKRWARNVLVVYFLFSFCATNYRAINFIPPLNIITILGSSVHLIGLVATILLFLKPSREWFDALNPKKNKPISEGE